MPDVPMRYIHFDVSKKESYSLDTVGKHGFGMFWCFFSVIHIKRVWVKDNVWSILCSHGDRPPATWCGEVQHLYSDETWRAAHARLGPFLQLRCSLKWPIKWSSFAPPHHKPYKPACFVLRYYFWRRVCGCVHHGQTHWLPKRHRD